MLELIQIKTRFDSMPETDQQVAALMPPIITSSSETEHVGRWQRHGWTAAP
jgi:hypothetical protein